MRLRRELRSRLAALAWLSLIVMLLQWPSAVRAQDANRSPGNCREALALKIPSGVASVSVPADHDAIELAEEIEHFFAGGPIHPGLARAVLDSLVNAHGEDMLRSALVMMMTGRARVHSYTDVGLFYALVEADTKYLTAILLNSDLPPTQRGWALRAIASGGTTGAYRDSVAAVAVAALLCDVAYLLRPFTREDWDWLREPPPITPYDPVAERLFVIAEADELFNSSRMTLSDPEFPGARGLLRRYADWEPQPVLAGLASRSLER